MLRQMSALALVAVTLSACGAASRIGDIGKAPDMNPIAGNVMAPPASHNAFQSMPDASMETHAAAAQRNSLWRAGSRQFFKDARASKIGDILTVNIDINDRAKVDNTTTRSRTNNNSASIPSFPFGLDKAGDLVNAGSNTANKGSGSVNRSEAISLTIAAVVTQVLPNGNLVIQGRQQVRVNYEMRDLTIAGVVRPEDISGVNTVKHTQIAEARVSYGGKGQITDLQQPGYGQQLYEILMPF